MAGAGITLKDLSVGYPGRTLVSDVNVAFPAGSLSAIVGRNGTGKSTLLRTMAGLARPLSGSIAAGGDISGLSPRRLAETIGFVSTERIRVTNLKVRDVVSLGRTPYTNWIGRLTPEDETAVDEALVQVGMSDFSAKEMDTLSDGEAQRVMIARVLAQDTPVILLDEPTAFLDLPNRYEVCLLLRRLARERGKTVVFSSHDLAIVTELADRILVLEPGGVHFGSPAELIAVGSLGRIFEGTSIGLGEGGRIVYEMKDERLRCDFIADF